METMKDKKIRGNSHIQKKKNGGKEIVNKYYEKNS